jgi:hypothetical protein
MRWVSTFGMSDRESTPWHPLYSKLVESAGVRVYNLKLCRGLYWSLQRTLITPRTSLIEETLCKHLSISYKSIGSPTDGWSTSLLRTGDKILLVTLKALSHMEGDMDYNAQVFEALNKICKHTSEDLRMMSMLGGLGS